MDRGASLKVSNFGRGAERAMELAPSLLDRRKEMLYIIFAPAPPATPTEEFYKGLLKAIRRGFYSTKGGVTRALREAVKAAGRFLWSEGVRGSLACVALKGEEAYFALSGPGKVLIWDGARLKEVKGGEPAPGENQLPLLRLGYAPLNPNAVMIFSPESLEVGALKRLEKVLRAKGGEGALALLEGLAQDPDAWSFVLEPPRQEEAAREGVKLPLSPVPEVKVEEIADRVVEGASTLGRLARKSLLPQEVASPGARKAPSRVNLAKVLALAIPLLVIILIALAYFQRERAIQGRFNLLLTQAEHYIVQAKEASDESIRRSALDKASEALDEARLLRPLAPRLLKLEEELKQLQDEIYKIQRAYRVIPLLEFDEPGTLFRRLCVEGRDIYVLDKGNDRVYHYRLNEVGDGLVDSGSRDVVLEKGQLLGDSIVGELVDMTCYAAPEPEVERGLLVLDASGSLFKLIPPWGSPRRLELAGGFAQPELIGSYGGRFYVLDGEKGQLWRYVPTDSGYAEPPQAYFPASVEMEGVRDLALDGYVYLLFSDGRILKFLMGEEQPFSIQGLDKPLGDPAALFTLPEEDLERPVHSLYVADRANGRLVQLDKGGNFVRQVLPGEGEAFGDVQDFVVDEGKKQAFLLTSGGLFLALLP